jgi:hypothetical protein
LCGSFQFCEPKTEVEIVDPTDLSRDKKLQKKSQKLDVLPIAGRQPRRDDAVVTDDLD